MEALNELLRVISDYVWNLPLVFALLGTGVLFTLTLHFVQFKGFFHALKVIRGKFDSPNDPGEINHFEALTTALSATVGLGNIGGVAIAIHIGGPGAVFWMIIAGFLGMATKFAECSLSVMYRRIDDKGEVHGGPMHYIERGLGTAWKPMASFFAFACVVASFGAANMFQTNQVALILDKNFSIPPLASGLVIAILTAAVIIGGIKRIGHVTSKLVPLMGGIYVAGAFVVILSNITQIPHMVWLILHDAFTGTAAQGGLAGIAVQTVLIQGVRRACFSNEAGLGSAPIAHSAAATNEPIREGVVALLEPFIDTIVICTMTAMVILLSGAWTQDANGVELTALAFDTIIPGFGQYFVPIAVSLFAYSTLISWSYYGERSVDYLWNSKKGILFYKIVFCILAVAGALWEIGPVLNFSDIMLGLMAAPNLVALLVLMPKVRSETISYFTKLKSGQFVEHGPTI